MHSKDLKAAASFYVNELGFEITQETEKMISLCGKDTGLFIERGPQLGPVLEMAVRDINEAKINLVNKGCKIVKDEPDFSRCYVQDPHGLIYNIKL